MLPSLHVCFEFLSGIIFVGFDDALKSLDKLNGIPFKLPVDLAVRPFSNIKDAF